MNQTAQNDNLRSYIPLTSHLINFLSWSKGLSVISIPSIQILPLIFLAILVSPIRRVDLPLPLRPQMATFWRVGMWRVSPAGKTVNTDHCCSQ